MLIFGSRRSGGFGLLKIGLVGTVSKPKEVCWADGRPGREGESKFVQLLWRSFSCISQLLGAELLKSEVRGSYVSDNNWHDLITECAARHTGLPERRKGGRRQYCTLTFVCQCTCCLSATLSPRQVSGNRFVELLRVAVPATWVSDL